MSDRWTVSVGEGKYAYVYDATAPVVVLRHGESWRDVTGDKFIYCLASELKDAREKIAELESQIEQAHEWFAGEDI